MQETFDPYHRWLGIPPKHQPPDHYRLLGIERFEDDPEVIADAAERQMAHVRRYHLGHHSDLSQHILNELGAAKACLLNADKKAEYDQKLRERSAAQQQAAGRVGPSSPSSSPPAAPPAPASPKMPAALRQPPVPVAGATDPSRLTIGVREAWPLKHRTRMSSVAVIGWAGVGGVLLALLVVLLTSLFSPPGVTDGGRFTPSKAKPTAAKPTTDENPLKMASRREGVERSPRTGRVEQDYRRASAAESVQKIVNSIGMTFALISEGEFQMGSLASDSDADDDEKPRHLARITKPYYLGITEVTQSQYERVMGTNPSKFKGAELPVENISWADAADFCRKLSMLEGRAYRLPNEAEWEYACRAGSDDESTLGECAWYEGNSGASTHPVGEKKPNAWGLYDMRGNVYEWCSDWFGAYVGTAVSDPAGATAGSSRVLRGGGWRGDPRDCRSAGRYKDTPHYRGYNIGFRVASSSVESTGMPGGRLPEAEAPSRPPAKLPESNQTSDSTQLSDAEHPEQPAEESGIPEPGRAATTEIKNTESAAAGLLPKIENSIGMRFTLIPAGEFLMGSPASDRDASSDEKPPHLVRITKSYYLGVTEVTQGQYERLMRASPSNFKGAELPVENVSWEDAVEFCQQLSVHEGRSYRLPTEAEWEYACRAGSRTMWSFGDAEWALGDFAWYAGNSGSTTHAVAEKKPNAWGLYDMHGNVLEWCSDRPGEYPPTAISNPIGATAGLRRVFRGGSWDGNHRFCRSAYRSYDASGSRHVSLGFRVASSSVDASGK